ncbi:MAG: DUF3567 domain-containing protein [Comamonadaceae bacterium]|jgi:hypothetical protein|nr:DUF3567 domain-containing protein [Comamonadaceae bacterium]
MQMLYDSDSFVVVHMVADAIEPIAGAQSVPQMVRHGFEIVDKRHGREVFLDGSWAELFQERLKSWQDKTPSQDEIEATLEGYAQLAQTPIAMH